jgi:hypothetical protein
MKSYKVILTKAGWCGHCKIFAPIFDEVSKKSIDEYKNLEFESYDLENKNKLEKENFENSYPELISKVEYYPTIFLIIKHDDKIISGTINHVTSKSNHEKDLEEAVNNFITNIINGFKSLESNGKQTFINTSTQQGGNKCCSIENTHSKHQTNNDYKLKYIKYKTKYMELISKIK